jgi:AraC-like DNA-binding protein
MSYNARYLAVDNPNVPLLSGVTQLNLPIGQFVDPVNVKPEIDLSLFSKQDVTLRDMYLPKASIRTYSGKFGKDAVLINKTGFGTEYVGSCFFLDGYMSSHLPGQKNGIDIQKGMHNMKYDPHNEFTHFCPSNREFKIVHFALATNFFFDILPENESWADALRNRINKRERIMPEKAAAITLDQYSALQKINECQISGELGHIMLETYVAQILLLQLHSLFQQDENAVRMKLSRRDLDITQEVRSYIDEYFLADHSLSSLAKHFGVNTNKLMTIFKKIFNVSIFEYISELRMNHARKLLQDGFLVSEVASQVGYKNPHHFSVAFKKKFGICPSSIKEAA